MAGHMLSIEIFSAVWAVLCLLAGAVVTDTLLRDGNATATDTVLRRQG